MFDSKRGWFRPSRMIRESENRLSDKIARERTLISLPRFTGRPNIVMCWFAPADDAFSATRV
jgi:hypothetical protein